MSLDLLAAMSEELDVIAQGVFPDARAYTLGSHPDTIGRDVHFLTFQVAGNDHERDFSGGSEIAATRFEVAAVAFFASHAYALSDAVRRRLDNLRGPIGTNNTVFANGIFVENEVQAFEPSTDQRDQRTAYVMDLVVWAAEEDTPE
jgi:hypothetical protein